MYLVATTFLKEQQQLRHNFCLSNRLWSVQYAKYRLPRYGIRLHEIIFITQFITWTLYYMILIFYLIFYGANFVFKIFFFIWSLSIIICNFINFGKRHYSIIFVISAIFSITLNRIFFIHVPHFYFKNTVATRGINVKKWC